MMVHYLYYFIIYVVIFMNFTIFVIVVIITIVIMTIILVKKGCFFSEACLGFQAIPQGRPCTWLAVQRPSTAAPHAHAWVAGP